MKIPISKFRKTAEELRESDKENNIKLLGLLKYMRMRNRKKIQKGANIDREH